MATSSPEELAPPATRTNPFGSNVAVWLPRGTLGLPVKLNVPLTGSYSSAVGMMIKLLDCGPIPPTISTCSFGKRVAVWDCRPVVMEPVSVNWPVAGLKISAVALGAFSLFSSRPPVMRIVPSANGVEAWKVRSTFMNVEWEVKTPVEGL